MSVVVELIEDGQCRVDGQLDPWSPGQQGPGGLARRPAHPEVVVVPLVDVTPVTIALAYSTHRSMPAIGRFAQLARERLGADVRPPAEQGISR
ncbi:hypothetical protein ACGFYV_09650 [Streptomyces sp. NPDC048297]|uniref:hypothetical protein n=1 Tax=Streptomyces sp. NPDC048297 TaxID=3365531 RepID=UPI003712727D